ncbi:MULTISPECIES: 2-phospho-L-lactate guanylyltransferase [unclassified Microbacterium]|uniref:2-phospho-L-lactate guanylyltransferase n=1 Tax=unclassified Microbacterium TaxID=2609290 RepID=UPI000C2CB94E|nr:MULTISPECIES: 2-phospho-L-lactate guanylyltransferase [unclassified Microbacterium]
MKPRFRGVGWTVIIPVKPTALGKSRLGPDAAGRHGLAAAVALDTVHAAYAARNVREVIVVTDDPHLSEELGGISGISVLREDGPRGVDGAIAYGARTLDRAVARAALLGDLPALRPQDLDRALTLAEAHDRAVVPDAEGTGSTLVTARGGIDLVTSFGVGSLDRHAAAGCRVLNVARGSTLRRDVDTAAHLETARTLGLGERTAALLPQSPETSVASASASAAS